jgi:hypothetical protein
LELLFELAGQLGVRRILDRGVKNRYDDVAGPAYVRAKLAADLIEAAADPITGHGRFIYLAADHHGHPVGVPAGVLSRLDGEQRPPGDFSTLVGITQAVVAVEAMRAGQHRLNASGGRALWRGGGRRLCGRPSWPCA